MSANAIASQIFDLFVQFSSDNSHQASDTGLTAERLSILKLLSAHGPQTINQLAEKERVSAPAITRTVKSLEKLGYVIKSRARNDQRVVYVALTRKSQTLLEQQRQQYLELIVKRLEGLNEQQLLTLEKAIEFLNNSE